MNYRETALGNRPLTAAVNIASECLCQYDYLPSDSLKLVIGVPLGVGVYFLSAYML